MPKLELFLVGHVSSKTRHHDVISRHKPQLFEITQLSKEIFKSKKTYLGLQHKLT